MSALNDTPEKAQSLLTEQFFYFFLRVRKSQVRKVVDAVNKRYPEETLEQRARRLIAAQTALSFLGGTILHLPIFIPGLGQALKLIGVVGGASALTRMHLYLILEIALLYSKDIDDEERVPEMVAVVLATGAAAGAPFLFNLLDLNPLYSLPVAGVAASSVAQVVGETAIRFYGQAHQELIASYEIPLLNPSV